MCNCKKWNRFAFYIMGLLSNLAKKVLENNDISTKAYDKDFLELFNECKQFTMTSIDRMQALYDAVNYVLDNNLKGDFVECGVWKGGSSLLVALLLKRRGIKDKKLYLYDTYEGMSEPTEDDVSIDGQTAAAQLKKESKEKSESVWCVSGLDEVKQNLALANLESDQVIFVKGKVEETIPEVVPSSEICLLRLDTDWYESTKHELVHLYPKLVNRGVMIIDDYGHWQGSKKAVDEYFLSNEIKPLLSRIDYTGRMMIKY